MKYKYKVWVHMDSVLLREVEADNIEEAVDKAEENEELTPEEIKQIVESLQFGEAVDWGDLKEK